VSLLSGRNFEIRTFENEIAENSFATLKQGVLNFTNETNYKRFLMIIKSAGFISPELLRSQNVLNFAYIVYLKLKELGVNSVAIEKYVRRWLVYTILTGRYSGSPESAFDFDIKQIALKPFDDYLKEKEDGELSDAFWNAALPQSLDTSVADNNMQVSGLSTQQGLLDNLKMNCVPTEIMQMSIEDYSEFLSLRRKLMATKIKEYYFSL